MQKTPEQLAAANDLTAEELNIIVAALRFCAEDIGETGGSIKNIPGRGFDVVEMLRDLASKLA